MTLNLRRVWAIVLRQIFLYGGSPQRVLPLFAWVAVDMVLWGYMTRYLNTIGPGGMNFVPMLLGAVLLWDFLTRVMQGVTMAFFEDVWSRSFLNIFASPISVGEYMLGLIATGVITSLLGLVAMVALASTVFGLSFLVYGPALLPFLLVLFLTGIALGMFGVSLVLRFGPASEWLIWPIPTLLSPFAGVFYPVTVLPGWMQAVSRALPPAYVFEGMRAAVRGQPVSLTGLGVGAGLAVFYVALGGATFAAVYRHAIRTGLIARYSAETLN